MEEIDKAKARAFYVSGYREAVTRVQAIMRDEDYTNPNCKIPISLMRRIQELYDATDNKGNH